MISHSVRSDRCWPILWATFAALALAWAAPCGLSQGSGQTAPPPSDPGLEWAPWQLARVVDGDTLGVVSPDDGASELVRLLCADTEEKSASNSSATKPATAFGLYTAGWAAGWFRPLEGEPSPPTVYLGHEVGGEDRDSYGRLLAHVWYRGCNYGTKLVREGWSPYFNKYGNSRVYDVELREAQRLAQEERLGIWDPERAKEGATRPYAELLEWWDLRASLIDRFREWDREHPDEVLEVRTDLEEIRQRCADGEDLVVFGEIVNIREVRGGNLWLEFDTPRDLPFIVFVPSSARRALDGSHLGEITGTYARNYAYFRGTGAMYHDIAEIVFSSAEQILLDWPPNGRGAAGL
jgi:micrococcal nuclease